MKPVFFRATIKICLAAFLIGAFITGCPQHEDTDTKVPSISSTVPLNAAKGVAIDGTIAATFSEEMDPTTLTKETFTLMHGSTLIPGTVICTGVTATFHSARDLAANTVYTATITTGAMDLGGNALPKNYEWSFTTGSEFDTTEPVVQSTNPANRAISVPINRSVTATFSEAMDPLTITSASFKLKQGRMVVPGTVAYAGVTATFKPASDLAANTVYTATITKDAADMADNAMVAGHVWSFTTSSISDTKAPVVKSVNPMNYATSVPINRSVVATFSEAMDSTTVSTTTFLVSGPGTNPVSGAVTYVGNTATFRPLADLALNTMYHVVVTTGMKDLAGNALVNDFTWSFTTGSGIALGPDPVTLGLAGDFVILSKSGIDTVPTSAITGNIGVSPIDSTAITGFSLTVDASNLYSSSDQVTGMVYAADYASPTPSYLTTAISNMETAYTDAAGRTTPDHTELGAGEIGGLTLAPGLYKWGTDVLITTDVTFNGGPNDVWIFQIAGGVTQASGTRVNLTGGALAKNVFWQTFGQLMIGTTAHFEGIVLCQTAVILGTGASVNGRLLAQTAVTLDQNAVTQP